MVDLGRRTVALFVLGDPNTLQLADLSTGNAVPLAENIGRALQRAPGSAGVTYVDKQSDGDWRIREVVPGKAAREIGPTVVGSEDFIYLPDGRLLAGDGAALAVLAPGEKSWKLVADLAEHGIRRITRLAAHPGGRLIALVADRTGGHPPPPEIAPLTLVRIADQGSSR